MTTAITTHETIAESRLREVFKDKTSVRALISALALPANALDAALMQLLLERTVDAAIGAQLDIIGKIVGIARTDIDAALSDDDYRRYVRATIWKQRSNGIVFDILRVVRLVINDLGASHVLEMQFPAGLIVRIDDVAVTTATAAVAAQFLRGTASGGVRALLETSGDVPAEMFTFARFSPLDGAHSGGSGTIEVLDASKFDAAGSLILDEALGVEETVAYTSRTGTVFTLSGTTANAHDDNASVTQVGSPGKGFDDEAAPGAGGKFATAKEGS